MRGRYPAHAATSTSRIATAGARGCREPQALVGRELLDRLQAALIESKDDTAWFRHGLLPSVHLGDSLLLECLDQLASYVLSIGWWDSLAYFLPVHPGNTHHILGLL